MEMHCGLGVVRCARLDQGPNESQALTPPLLVLKRRRLPAHAIHVRLVFHEVGATEVSAVCVRNIAAPVVPGGTGRRPPLQEIWEVASNDIEHWLVYELTRMRSKLEKP